MRVIAFTLALGLFLSLTAFAQENQPPVVSDTQFLRDHAQTRGFSLGRPVRPKPTPDGKAVIFLRAEPRIAKLSLYEFDVATSQTRQLLTSEQILRGAEENLSLEEKARRERQRVSVGGITDFQLSDDGSLILITLGGKLYLLHRATAQVRELPTGDSPVLDPKFSPDAKSIAFVRNYDVQVMDLATSQVRSLTTGGTERLSHGLAEFVAQEEMHRFTGYWWSPDSRFILYEESDTRHVEVWYVSDPAHPEQPAYASAYPRPGKANAKVRLAIQPVAGGQTTWIPWDSEKYPYLGFVRWDKLGPLVLGVQTRDQKQLLLLTVDPATGQTTPLLTQRDPAWVNLPLDLPKWLPDNAGFLWVSESGGGPQLELRNPKGDLLRVLVPPQAGYQGLVSLDPDRRQIIYSASPDPTQTHLWRVSLDGGQPNSLTTTPGRYTATFSQNHELYVQSASTLDAMPATTVHRADGSLIGQLPSVAENPPFAPKVQILQVGENPAFYASILRPRHFNPAKRYPVIVDVYGGPTATYVSSTLNRYLLNQWMADQGFIVVSLDNRGTPGRGRDWERAVYKHFGSVPLDDQVAGLKALGLRFPEMDLQRVGIHGWSFGGYLSALAVLRRPDVFKAAVAGAPVVDWLDYDTHYTERYLGFPDTDASAYREASLLTYAADLQRPLLLVHGTKDDNVYFRHSLRLADALFRAGRDFEILPLSGLTHMVPDPLVSQRLWSRIILHFHRHLGPPSNPQ